MALTKTHNRMVSGAPINVKDLGAVGDADRFTGSGTDDTAAIQAALDIGGDIFIPAGSYKITSPLELKKTCRIIGEGQQDLSSTIRTHTQIVPVGNIACFTNDEGGLGGQQYNIQGINIWFAGSLATPTDAGTESNKIAFNFISKDGDPWTAPYSEFKDIEVNNAWRVLYDNSDNYKNNFKRVVGRYVKFGFYKRLGTMISFDTCSSSIGEMGFHLENVISPQLRNCSADSLNITATTPGTSANYFFNCNSLVISGWDAEAATIDVHLGSYMHIRATHATIQGFTGLANTLTATSGSEVSFIKANENSNLTLIGFQRLFLPTLSPLAFTGSGECATIKALVGATVNIIGSDVRAPTGGTPSTRYSINATGGKAHVFQSTYNETTANIGFDLVGTVLSMAGSLSVSNKIEIGNSAWDDTPLKLGNYVLWVDSTGDLRIKNGAPTSDTDGTVVGTQS